ncbi:MAG TPA: efflux RND transporter periplasmic adaptor subunit [Terriglobales bacterium]|nr:efflux RND transporter periplasmic adaptor subunit [Terriglobales bacterium]
MATQGPVVAMDIATFSAQLLDSREVSPRARIVAQFVADLLPASAVNVYLLDAHDGSRYWVPRATAGDVSVDESAVPLEQGALGILARRPRVVVFSAKELPREQYAHLHVRKTLHSIAYLPLQQGGELVGGVEILSFEEELTEDKLSALQPVTEIITKALASAVAYEQERHSALSSITRLTQLYDLEKVFSSTIELDQLLPLIGSKFREVLECQAVNVWLLQGDESLALMHQAGVDPTIQEGAMQRPGDGIAGDISDNGEPVLIESAKDERLTKRNTGVEEGAIFSLMAAPLIDRGALVGVVEAVNRLDGTPFDEDQLFALTTLTETAVGALHNASLLMAERKVEILEALVRTSGEITSTLDVDRVLQAIVNGPASVVPYERAAIALDERGGIELKAVSGTTQLNADDPQYRGLREILRWGDILREPLLVSQRGGEIDSDREETRAKFQAYFAETGMRACHLIPLLDDEGRVGVLLFESSDPDFLSEAHLEMIKVLASQATVALRNASLYKEVPFIGVLQPLVERKRRFLALGKHRQAVILGAAAAAVVFLLAFPLPLRVTGTAVVTPARMAHLGSEFEGVIKTVRVREGDMVKKGTVIAELEDWDYRASLAAARARYETAVAEMNRALAGSDGSKAGIQKAQADYWASEVMRAQERLEKASIRSPIDGIIATPHIENLTGHKLKAGESFVDIVDNSQAVVDVSIDETDVALLRAGEKARLKLEGFPSRTFQGQVAVVSPQGTVLNGEPVFFARVTVPNPDGALRAGMQGRGKISTGWRPAGVVMFRGAGIWIWSKLWNWFGW